MTPEKKCATLYSCFWLVGRHQQGVAHLPSGVTELYTVHVGPRALIVVVSELMRFIIPHTVEAKITFTYRLRRTVKVRLVSFPFYGQPFFGTLRKRLKNGKSTVKRRLKNG